MTLRMTLLCLLLLPSLALAQTYTTPSGVQITMLDNGATYQLVDLQTPTGILVKVWQFIGGGILVDAAHADELPLIEQYKSYATTMAEFYGFDPNTFSGVINCESGWNNDSVGDKGKARGILQFWRHTFEVYSKKYNFVGEYLNAFDQLKLGAITAADIGMEKDWWNCSNFVRTGTWNKKLWK